MGRGQIERSYPLMGAVVLSTTALIFFGKMSVETISDFNRLGDHALRINTVLLGFFLTMFGIVGTIKTQRMKVVKAAGLFPQLMRYNKVAIQSQFYSIVVVIITSFYQFFEGREMLDRIIASLLIFALVYSFLAAFRFSRLFLKLIVDPDDLKNNK